MVCYGGQFFLILLWQQINFMPLYDLGKQSDALCAPSGATRSCFVPDV